MVRDGVLSLPRWFSRDIIDDVLSSVCLRLLFFVVVTVCLCPESPIFVFVLFR